jgi:hypothetical protein
VTMRAPWSRWRAWWRGRPRKRRFVGFVAFLAAIELLVQVGLPRLSPDSLTWIRDLGVDRATRLAGLPTTQSGNSPSRPYVFLDIDQSTWRDERWGEGEGRDGGEPAQAPRSKLLALIRLALARGADVVILDVASTHWKPRREDDVFWKGLLDTSVHRVDSSVPMVVLVDEVETPKEVDEVPPQRKPRPVQSHPLPFVQGAGFTVVEGSTAFDLSPVDHELRDWKLWELRAAPPSREEPRTTCVAVLPSVQVLVAAHVFSGCPREASGAAHPSRCRPEDLPWERGTRFCSRDSQDAGAQAVEQADHAMAAVVGSLLGQHYEEGSATEKLLNRIQYTMGDQGRAEGRPYLPGNFAQLSVQDLLFDRPELTARMVNGGDWSW